ncbi:3'-5' exonuclease [Youxingia wuxianensis]|uniref:DNA 3'-5' helicase n=1 Tax=Youxingia wuxianensis TaxID=2763678 RepID=A0A926IHU6_9FIRM|nr:3'-5' exonuclease [Youxingia wuxianensis]MBC8585495.1 UvrD-helicase domain-containing protein [Youxingia wuxianensis]
MNTTLPITLNSQQREVVENLQENILLLAGAGTGKTNTLAYRIAAILSQKKASPEEILCLTFTNRACKEMKERISSIVGAASLSVDIFTVHSFCAQLLRTAPSQYTDISGDFAVFDETDSLEVVREVMFEIKQAQVADRPAQIVQSFIGLVKEIYLLDPAGGYTKAAAQAFVSQREKIERLCLDQWYQPDPKFFRFLGKYGVSLVELYNQKMAQNNALDFNDLLIKTGLLLSQPEFFSLWKEKYKFVHVDEVQDVSIAEYRLIRKLCLAAVTLICGDFNQTIYQWRGSQPNEIIPLYQRDFSPVTIRFTSNYRSSQGLLSLARQFLFNAFHIGEAAYSPGSLVSGENPDVILREFDTCQEEADFICQTVAGLSLQDACQVAVIARTNKACGQLCQILQETQKIYNNQVQFVPGDQYRMFRCASVKDLLAGIHLLLHPFDSESLKRLLIRYVKGVGEVTVNAIIQGYKQGLGISLCDFVDRRTFEKQDFFSPLLDQLECGNVIVFDVESTGTDVYTDDIIQIAAIQIDQTGRVISRFQRFLRPSKPVGSSEKVHGFSDRFLEENGEDPAVVLKDFLAFAGEDVIVGHNVSYDMTILRYNLSRCNISSPLENLYYDTLYLSRRYLKDLPNYKLSTLAQRFNTPHQPSHDAMDDILATADLLVILADQYLRPTREARTALYKKYLSRFEEISLNTARLRQEKNNLDAYTLLTQLTQMLGIKEKYKDQEENLAALEWLMEFAREMEEKDACALLSRLLEISALSAGEMGEIGASKNKIMVITAHQAKGCEFDYVFLPMLQDFVFPTYLSIKSGNLEEEKRVFYVSITRAKKKLFLTWSAYGDGKMNKASRFLKYIE